MLAGLLACLGLAGVGLGDQIIVQRGGRAMAVRIHPGHGSGGAAGSATFAVHTADQTLLEQIETYQEHVEAGDWVKAWGVLEELRQSKQTGLLQTEDGFLLPLDRYLWQSLASLPPEGRHAFGVFNNAKAQALLRSATPGSEQEIPTLQKVFDHYFITEAGAQAANQLGDAYFERGQFARAAACYQAILDYHPNADLSLPRLQFKQAIALGRAGRTKEAANIQRLLASRHANQVMSLGGQTVDAAAYLEGVIDAPAAPQADAPPEPPALPKAKAALWTQEIVPEAVLTQAASQLMEYGMHNGLPAMSVAADDKRILLNWLGITAALDPATGQPRWGQMDQFQTQAGQARNFVSRGTLGIGSIELLAGRLVVVGPSLQRSHLLGMSALNPQTGDASWSSDQNDAFNNANVEPHPILVDGTLYAATSPYSSQQLELVALDMNTGRPRWSMSLGTVGMPPNQHSSNTQIPQPRLAFHDGVLYVLTNSGALLAVDPSKQRLLWGMTYPSSRVGSFNPNYGRWEYGQAPPASLAVRDGQIYFKESGSDALRAIDLHSQQRVWETEIDSSAYLVDSDDDHLYMLGESLTAYDRRTGERAWWSSHTQGTASVWVTPGHLTAWGKFGVVTLDKRNGKAVRLFSPPDDPGSPGPPQPPQPPEGDGHVLMVDGKLVLVSKMNVTAYPLPDEAQPQQGTVRP